MQEKSCKNTGDGTAILKNDNLKVSFNISIFFSLKLKANFRLSFKINFNLTMDKWTVSNNAVSQAIIYAHA